MSEKYVVYYIEEGWDEKYHDFKEFDTEEEMREWVLRAKAASRKAHGLRYNVAIPSEWTDREVEWVRKCGPETEVKFTQAEIDSKWEEMLDEKNLRRTYEQIMERTRVDDLKIKREQYEHLKKEFEE